MFVLPKKHILTQQYVSFCKNNKHFFILRDQDGQISREIWKIYQTNVLVLVRPSYVCTYIMATLCFFNFFRFVGGVLKYCPNIYMFFDVRKTMHIKWPKMKTAFLNSIFLLFHIITVKEKTIHWSEIKKVKQFQERFHWYKLLKKVLINKSSSWLSYKENRVHRKACKFLPINCSLDLLFFREWTSVHMWTNFYQGLFKNIWSDIILMTSSDQSIQSRQ